MPRWPKTASDFNEDIMKSQAKIARYTDLIDNEKSRLEELYSKKREAEMQELYEFMQQTGLTASEVVQVLQSNQGAYSH